MKTIKELADSIGVSKVSVYKAIKRDDIKRYAFKQDNITFVNEKGIELLISLFNSRKSLDVLTGSKHNSKSLNQEDNDGNTDIYQENTTKFLMEQVKGLQEELKVERNSNRELADRLANIIENQQKLQATQMITDGNAKKSLWKKFFGRKDNSGEI